MKKDELVKHALADVGKNRSEVGCAGDYPWCAHWVSNKLAGCNMSEGVWSKSCTEMQRCMDKSKFWSEPETWPEPADVIFFDFDHAAEAKPLDHVGIVTDFDENTGTVEYVNGNGDDPLHITKQTISVNSAYVAYWMRYVENPEQEPKEDNTFDANLRVLKRGCKGNDVKSLQRLLFADGYSVGSAGDDGDFGSKTESAVKNYQTDHHITSDGVVGPETFKSLWGC
jgi:hypothetical protein